MIRPRAIPGIAVALVLAAGATSARRSAAGPAQPSGEVPICAIQGDTPRYLGMRVTTTGVVTADFTATGQHGFFLQDPGCDSDAATSDGIWAATGPAAVAAPEGHRLSVTGRVMNDLGLTQIQVEGTADLGTYAGSVEAIRLATPAEAGAAAAYLGGHAGMLVAVPPSRVVGATDRFGEAYVMPVASGITRLFRGPADPRKLGLAQPSGWLALDTGDLVSDAVGPLTFTFGAYKVLLRSGAALTVARAGVAPAGPPAAPAGGLTVAAWNLENLFDPVPDPGGASADVTPTADEYAAGLARRAASIARSLGSPDVLAVEEAENTGVLEDLARQPALLAARYRPVLVDGPDPRGIDVGLLYREDRLWLRSAEARQGCTDVRVTGGLTTPCALATGTAGVLLFARPPLVVHLDRADTGERLTFVVNHFKSQEGDAADSDRLRAAQAQFVRGLVAELQAADPGVPVIVLGDLNDFEDGATLARLTGDGALVDLHGRTGGTRPYTYVYQGVSEVLDYVLVDRTLVPRVREVRAVHANADYADPGRGVNGSSPHASDHDAVVAVIGPR